MKDTNETPTDALALADEGIHPNGRPWRRAYLDNPISRGDTKITSVQVTKPIGGDTRGTTMTAVYALDVDALATVLPRITEPTIHKAEIYAMPGEDVATLGGEVVSFLLNNKAKKAAGLTE